MSDVTVQLPLDRSGRNPDNLMGSEEHTLAVIPGFPYKLITLYHGGFFTNGLKVYDAQYNLLAKGVDYIVTYFHQSASEFLGLDICSAIVFLDKTRTGKVFTSAQMVGGDLAFSFTVKNDYKAWYLTQPANYVPVSKDYYGDEPIWEPGELESKRWALDTYQPFNNELDMLARATTGAVGTYEGQYRLRVKAYYDQFLTKFNTQLDDHIADKSNPHFDTKTQIGKALVNNFPLADTNTANAGVSNAHYLTPLRAYKALVELGETPLTDHTNITNGNPHVVTPAQINAPEKTVVNASVATKYGRNDTVANANKANYNGVKEYIQVVNEARTNIPAGNFTAGPGVGYLHPARIGAGAPTAGKFLRSNGVWTTFESLFAEKAPNFPSTWIGTMSFAVGTTQAQAHQFILSQPEYLDKPIGSVIFYRIRTVLEWGWGNGIEATLHDFCHASMNTPSGWVMV